MATGIPTTKKAETTSTLYFNSDFFTYYTVSLEYVSGSREYLTLLVIFFEITDHLVSPGLSISSIFTPKIRLTYFHMDL